MTLKLKKLKKDYSGQAFGNWQVLSYAGHIGKSDAVYLCKCSCGKEVNVRIRCLKRGQKTCGECTPIGSDHYAWKGCGELPKDVYNSIRHSADAKELEFSITIEYLWDLFLKQNKRCALTGWELFFNKTYKTKTSKTASLDRIDSSKGYIEGNLQWVHRDVNKLKKNLDDNYFVDLCLAVANYKNSRAKDI